MEKTPGQELSDLFYGLQMTVKILEGIMIEYKDGKRSQSDYESRIHSQSHLLNDNLKGVKPLVEKLFTEAYSRFDAVNIQQGQQGDSPKQEETDSSRNGSGISEI
jgi:hypothetical protein